MNCPYCGYPITKDNVLFKYDSKASAYQDKRRYAFHKLCSSNWPLDSDRFEGLYYFAADAQENSTIYDVNDFPVAIKVSPCDGRTPNELEEMCSSISGAPLDNFIAQYGNKNPLNVISVQKPESEIKPSADGSVVAVATRACPNCHNTLHQKFGQIPSIAVTLLGGPSAGKTAYLLSLTHQLSAQLSAHGLGTAILLDASRQYYDYLNASYQTMGTPVATVRGERLFPFVFYYTNRWNKECFVTFYDIAGESFDDADALLNHRGVMEASTLMLLLDPNQLNHGLYGQMSAPAGDGTYAVTDSVMNFDVDIISFVTKAISINRPLGAFQNISRILAVFTKMDMVLETERDFFGAGRIDVNCLVRHDLGSAHNGGLDINVINKISSDLDIVVNRKYGYNFNLRRQLHSLFSNGQQDISVLLLGVSTHTLDNPKDIIFRDDVTPTAPKHRIIEPFLCILAQNGMIPVKRPETANQ